MEAWKKEITKGSLAEEVRREYKKLLSVGKSGEEAEALVVNYFHDEIAGDKLMTGRLWMTLALCEWELGRLTQNALNNARHWANYPWEKISKTSLEALLNTLDAPMPPQKKVRLPSHIAHCPWPVGSLLAYRIISSDHPHVTESPFYGKYVLLRIIMIRKQPVTWLAPEDAWNEGMLVGLYDWMGDSVPDPEIVDRLQFTAVSVEEPMLPASAFRNIPSGINPKQFQEVMARMTQPRGETCCDLDWRCKKPQKRSDVFTYLGCDPSFACEISSFFKTDICDYAMDGNLAFDAVLVNRFTQLAEENASQNRR